MSSENIVFGVDWNTVDKKYNWLAVDRDGSVYTYVDKPSGWGVGGCWNYRNSVGGYAYQGRYSLSPSEDWTTMLAERPKQESPKGHKHHKEMLLYAQDAALHEEPWKLWEWSEKGENYWRDIMNGNPVWCEWLEYRRKPQTVTITIPEDVAIAFTSLVLVSDAGKAVSVAIQEALNNRYD